MDEEPDLNEEIDQGEGEEEEIQSIPSDEEIEPDLDADDLDPTILEEEIDDEDEELEPDEINKEELGELNSIKPDSYKASFIFNEDLEANDSYQFLQKFDKESKNHFIASKHQECLSKNLDEIKDLMNVIRDKNNIIIDELHKTIPILSKYEKTRIIGIRLKQLNNGSLPYIKVPEDMLDNLLIAEKELKEKKIPFIIQRPLPNNTFEYWKLEDLEIL